MSAKSYCNIAIPHTRLGELTYEFDPERLPEVAPGACVQVRLRGKKVKGLVLEVAEHSPVPKTLPVEKLVESLLIHQQLLALLRWVGAYYFGRMGEVLGLALPRGICGYGLRRRARAQPGMTTERQTVAVSDLPAAPYGFPASFSVHVQTGSGSREAIVSHFVATGLARGTVIVLMPEPETGLWAGTLRARLGIEPVIYHGDLKLSERKRVWRALRSGERGLILGVRSAVFAPAADLAGVVVMEEHDSVFKEERHPRFNARDVAIARAKLAGCPVLLCDSTPSAETWLNLRNGQYRAVDGPAAVADRLADTIVVDMRRHSDDVLAPVLVNGLKEACAAGESAVLYVNRRGFSRYVVCRDCGSPLSCPSCAVSFVLFSGGNLCCRYCGRTSAAPETCPACGSPDFRFKVPGVEMVAREVGRLSLDAKVVTVTTDSVRQAAAERGAVVVGTRALLGFRWPESVRLVGALSVDADLCLPEFRAKERTFQVLAALSRRAAEHGATFVVQTRRPDDAAIRCAATGDVARFLDQELTLREELGFPPYRRLALVELSARSASGAARRGEWLCRKLGRAQGVEVLGPVPLRGTANAVQLMVKTDRSVRLDRLVTLAQLEADGVKAKIDIDPLETL